MDLLHHSGPKHASHRWGRLSFVLFAFVMAIMYDQLFWQKELGLGFLIFVLTYIIGMFLLTTVNKHMHKPLSILLVLPMLILSLNTFWLNNEMVQYLVPSAIVVLGLVWALFLTLENPHNHRFHFLGIPLFRSIDLMFTKWASAYRDLFHWKKSERADVTRKILLGLAISVPVLLIFGFLFYQADEIFAQWVRNLIHIQITAELVWRVFRTFALTMIGTGFFYCLVDKGNVLQERLLRARRFDPIIISIVLGLLNALFFAFVFIQIRYLFGGAEFVFESELTFSQYARKGFFEMVLIMIMSSAIVLYLHRSFYRNAKAKIVELFQVLLLLQVSVVAVSALKRMELYQDAFGYTVLRLYVEWFIYFVMFFLVISIVCILARVSFRRFTYVFLITGTAAFTLVSSLNVDAMIAQENVDRFLTQDKELDVSYLQELSVDILPVIETLVTSEKRDELSYGQRIALSNMIDSFADDVEKRGLKREFHLTSKRSQQILDFDSSVTQWLQEAQVREDAFSRVRNAYMVDTVGFCDETVPKNDRSVFCTRVQEAGKNYVIALSLTYNDYSYNQDESDAGERNDRLTIYEITNSGVKEEYIELSELDLNERLDADWIEQRGSIDVYQQRAPHSKPYPASLTYSSWFLLETGDLVYADAHSLSHYRYSIDVTPDGFDEYLSPPFEMTWYEN
jgi:hypothetical protein